MSSQTRAVSVVSSNVGWSSGIKGLDVDENKRVGPIIVMEDDVGRVRDGMSLHPLVDRALTSVSATLRRDTRGAKGRVKERNEGLDSGIMARRMESHAVRAADEMPVARASESVAQGLGNGGAGGAAGDVALPLRGRREEEIEGEGNWEVLGVLEGEEGCVAGRCVFTSADTYSLTGSSRPRPCGPPRTDCNPLLKGTHTSHGPMASLL